MWLHFAALPAKAVHRFFKAMRSSPRSIASACTPIIFTLYFLSIPFLFSSDVRFNPICPRGLKHCIRLSFSIIFSTSGCLAARYKSCPPFQVCHDGCRIGIDKNNLITHLAQAPCRPAFLNNRILPPGDNYGTRPMISTLWISSRLGNFSPSL